MVELSVLKYNDRIKKTFMIPEELRELYRNHTGQDPEEIVRLTPAGSNRRYFRLKGVTDLIGVEGESVDENKAFLYLDGHFQSKGLPVPKVVARSEDGRFYLQDDLGDVLLFDAIGQGRSTGVFSEREKDLLRQKTVWKMSSSK